MTIHDQKISQSDFARLVGISRQRVSALVQSGGLQADGTLGDWLRAYCGRLRAQAADDALPVRNERARLLRAQADREQLRLQEDQKTLVRVDAVRTALANVVAATRDNLMQLPARLAPVLAVESDQTKVHDAIRDELRQALFRLTQSPESFDDESSATPRPNDSQPGEPA